MENKEFDLEHLRELYEKELSNENNPSEKEPSKEKASDQGRFGEKKATSPSDNVSDTVDQGSFGQKKTQDDEESWICPACETMNTGNFCSVCGEKRPETEKEKLERERREAEERERQARELREKEEQEKHKQKEEKDKKRGKRKTPLIIGLCAAVILLVAGILFLQNGGTGNAPHNQSAGNVPQDWEAQTTRDGDVMLAFWDSTSLTINCLSNNRISVAIVDSRETLSSEGAFWELRLFFDQERDKVDIESNAAKSEFVRKGYYFWIDEKNPDHHYNVSHWHSNDGIGWVSVNGCDVDITRNGDCYTFLLDLSTFDGLSSQGITRASLFLENTAVEVEAQLDAEWAQLSTYDAGTDEAALAEDWNNASKYITVGGVDQAVFLDNSGRPVRLLLRSLGREEICADYRLEWNNGQIAAISRLDINGNLLIRHEFIYENGIFVSDVITSNLEIWYEDYEPWTDDYWADPVYPVADQYGQKIVGLPDREHGSREIFIFSDGIEYENPGLYVEYESFRLIVCDTEGQLGVVFNFNMDGTSNGYSADKLYDENWNEIG